MTIRNVNESDAELLQELAWKCDDVDIHTIYTYWVICRYFSNISFLMFDNGKPVGYIMAVENTKEVLIWQIGILKEYRKQKLSYSLIDAVMANCYKDVYVSIADSNISSKSAFRSYAAKNNYLFEAAGRIDLCGLDTTENERVYKLRCSDMKDIRAMLKHKLTTDMCRVVECVMKAVAAGIVSEDGKTALSGYVFTGIEPLTAKYIKGDVDDYEFCEEIKELLQSDGKLTQKSKAIAYDLLTKFDINTVSIPTGLRINQDGV